MEPKTKKILPSMQADRDIAGEWKKRYEEFRDSGLNQTEAISKISKEYGGVSRTAIRYHLFPTDKKKQQKSPSHQWANQREIPEFVEKHNARKSNYMSTRYHIDDHIRNALASAPQDGYTLENLGYIIKEQTGIHFRPSTLEGLVRNYEEKKGTPLLKEIPGYSPTRYSLHPGSD